MKEQKFERVKGVKYLYRRTYQTADGQWSTRFYGVFKTWQGKRTPWPLGSDLKTAKEALALLVADNIKRADLEVRRAKVELPPEKMTVAKYAPVFLKSKEGMPSHNFWKVCCGHIVRHLGPVPLDEVTRSKIAEYKALRKSEPIFRHGNPVKGSTVSASTVNREITTLLGLLSHAAENGLLEKLPATKRLKENENHLARERVLDIEELTALLDASPRWLQRIIIGADQACLSRSDALNLTVKDVHRKTGMIKLAGGRSKTKMTQKVPISPALAEVLDELDRERRKLTSIHGSEILFTKDAKPVTRDYFRKAFDAAVKEAKIQDFHFHDFRHNAVTRWAIAGIPEELRKIAAGHSRGSVHQRYINPPDAEMVRIFAERLGWKNVNAVFTQELKQTAESAK